MAKWRSVALPFGLDFLKIATRVRRPGSGKKTFVVTQKRLLGGGEIWAEMVFLLARALGARFHGSRGEDELRAGGGTWKRRALSWPGVTFVHIVCTTVCRWSKIG